MFYVHSGMRWKSAVDADGKFLRLPDDDWRLADRVSEPRWSLSFAWPGEAYAAIANWHAGTNEFIGWYINLQTPLRRSPVGFDYTDHTLDVVVAPDLASWNWKDEEELELAVTRGLFTPEEADRFRADGEGALERIRARAEPFDRDWSGWMPDPRWPFPELPEGWGVL